MQQAITCHSVIKFLQAYIQLVSSMWQIALKFDQSKQNAANCKPSCRAKNQNLNVPTLQNWLVSGLWNYSVLFLNMLISWFGLSIYAVIYLVVFYHVFTWDLYFFICWWCISYGLHLWGITHSISCLVVFICENPCELIVVALKV